MLVMVIQVNPTIDKVRLLFSFERLSLFFEVFCSLNLKR